MSCLKAHSPTNWRRGNGSICSRIGKISRQTEVEARQRAEEERLRREAEAIRRADQEQVYSAAKLADAVSAMDKFLAAYPESHLAGEAKALRATLIARDETKPAAVQPPNERPTITAPPIVPTPPNEPSVAPPPVHEPAATAAKRSPLLIGGGVAAALAVVGA